MLLSLHGNFSLQPYILQRILAYCPLASQQNFSNLNTWEMIQIMSLLLWHFPLWSQISEGHNILYNPGKPAGVTGPDFIDLEANKHCFTQLMLPWLHWNFSHIFCFWSFCTHESAAQQSQHLRNDSNNVSVVMALSFVKSNISTGYDILCNPEIYWFRCQQALLLSVIEQLLN